MPEDGDELLEVVNQSGEVIGHATRARCHADPSLIHRAVHLLLFDPAGRLFLQKRSARKLIQPGMWDTSVGGHLAPGESPEAAVRREAEEEVGLRDLELTPLHEYLWRSPVETELVSSFRATHNGDPIRLDPDEIEEGRFLAAREIRELAGAGKLTPNLLHELDRIGLLPAAFNRAGA